MSKNEAIQVTDAEWDVLDAIWNEPGQAAGRIIELVQLHRDWNHRTIRTLLRRLIEKGAVNVEIDGAKHLYRAAVDRNTCVRSATQSFSERFFSGSVRSLLLHLVEHQDLSTDEIEELRKRLDEKQRALGKKKKGKS
ncbi:MAG: BlaI/MecI/CopY family transcriptional regulator [Pirellulaceae bacterium]|nr:BlaI/MecI/CopY family transcriptional regulator [Pirellulaceae bacterium]